MGDCTFRRAFSNALRRWDDNSGLDIRPATSDTADINILFASGDHGDNSPFDGPGKSYHYYHYNYHYYYCYYYYYYYHYCIFIITICSSLFL